MSPARGFAHENGSEAGKSHVYLTPPSIIKDLGPFDLDPCAAPEPRPWPTAHAHIVEQEDGLAAPWTGYGDGWVWLNPPYGKHTGVWLKKLADHHDAGHGQGIALVFARSETAWFQEQVWPRADGLLFLAGRVRFHLPSGEPAKGGAAAPSLLIAQ